MRRVITASIIATALFLAVSPARAAFPGQNGKIAFWHSADTISTINPDGTGRAVLTSGRYPAWSPNGRSLALVDPGLYDPSLTRIDVVNADGTGRRTIVESCGGICNFHFLDPSWSRDGTLLAFTELQCDSAQCRTSIGTVPLSGKPRVNLGAGNAPAFAPNGSKIAFDRQVDPSTCTATSGCNREIYTMNADGSGVVRLTNDPADDVTPTWSPDGSKIAFVSARTGSLEIFIMNADGTGLRQRTTTGVGSFQPAWSPDGSQIAYVRVNNSTTDIFVMDAEGTSQGHLNLTSANFESEFDPDWQPLPPEPQRSDYKNAAQFCKALREFLGDEDFRARYGGGANAYGKCVSSNTH